MLYDTTTYYKIQCPTGILQILQKRYAGWPRPAPGREHVGGEKRHRKPVEAFFGGRAAWPPASGVIVRPGHAPAALGVGVDRGQPRHFWRCSSSRWPGHLTLEGPAFFLAFNFAAFRAGMWPRSRRRRLVCPLLADCLLRPLNVQKRLVLALVPQNTIVLSL